jgi:hypothetical protein
MTLTSAIILIICHMGDSIGFRQKMDIFDQDGQWCHQMRHVRPHVNNNSI